MNRRDCFRFTGAGLGTWGLLNGIPPLSGAVAQAAQQQTASGAALKITDIQTILTAPAGIRLVIVKVLTNQPGLYGLGCATFTQRPRTVVTAVQEYLRPFLLGQDPLKIEDIWQSSFVSSYWRNGPVLNNAISGVDMALWDILGKHCGLSVYQLWGGKCRFAVDTYRHASGDSFEAVTESVARYMEEGYRHIRVQVSVGELASYGSRSRARADGSGPAQDYTWEPAPYVRIVPRLFEHLRREVGDEVQLLHDVHERVPPILAIQLVKDVEQYRPFFIEDPFSPEDIGYFEHLRRQSSTPIAMGELFNNPHEWVSLITDRLIDFIRCHVSQVGGVTMARKIAALCEFFRVRTAWHGPGDTSPVGHAANVHLDLACHNFGIQEARAFSTAEQETFPGCPQLKDGYYHVNEAPGWGIDLNEEVAAKFSIRDDPPFDLRWGKIRRADGTVVKP